MAVSWYWARNNMEELRSGHIVYTLVRILGTQLSGAGEEIFKVKELEMEKEMEEFLAMSPFQ